MTLLKSLPTAVPLLASVKSTANNVLVVPLDCGFQVFPPSVVLMIAPLKPTAYPVFASGKDSPLREVGDPD
jgi:hypothetical protein